MKKIIIGSILGWFFFFSATAFATELGAYDSNGVASFYGVYDYPKEPEEEPVPPAKVPGNQQSNQQGEKILPATGSSHYSPLQLTGGICFLAAFIILSKRSRKNEKNSIYSGYSHL